MHYVLHMSDFHCFDPDQDKVKDRLVSIATYICKHFDTDSSNLRHGRRLAAVILTGDFVDARTTTAGAGSTDYTKNPEPLDRFELIRQHLDEFSNITKIHRDRFILVPGNHDVARNGSDGADILSNFIRFVNAFYRRTNVRDAALDSLAIQWPSPILTFTPATPGSLDGKVELRVEAAGEPILSVLVLATVKQYSDPNKKHLIQIDKTTLDGFATFADMMRSNCIRLAAMHNSPIVLPDPVSGISGSDRARPRVKAIDDAHLVVDLLNKCGVPLVLHGDKHEVQHTAGLRNLREDNWPLYTLGAGSLSKVAQDKEGADPQFHILRFDSLVIQDQPNDDPNCVELEVSSFWVGPYSSPHKVVRDFGVHPQDAASYALYAPARDHEELARPNKRGLGTLQMLELPQGRFSCRSDLAKRLLFNYRARLFRDIYEHSEQLIDDTSRTICNVQPHMMYSFFYRSILDTLAQAAEGSDRFLFMGGHFGKHTLWTENPLMIDLLTQQQRILGKYGASDRISVKRFLIIPERECQKLISKKTRGPDERGCKEFAGFCAALSSQHAGVWIALESAMKEQEEWGNTLGQELQIHRDRAVLSRGNLAVFATIRNAAELTLKEVTEENAVAFAYAQGHDPPKGEGNESAWISRRKDFIAYVRRRFEMFERLRSDGNRQGPFVPIKSLVTKEAVVAWVRGRP